LPPSKRNADERLGAHVSTQGGVHTAPERGTAIGATAIQVFTKTPSQWKEPTIADDIAVGFRDRLTATDIKHVVSHDSYLINLASPDPELNRRSVTAFVAELRRCLGLGITQVVSHPGNYIDERNAGLERNAKNYTKTLRAVKGDVMILIETTAGTGTALGCTFEELAALRESIGSDVRDRIGFCADTCHLYSAGYDLVNDYEGVWRRWDTIIGIQHLRCLHLNDSKTPFGSHRDRHELIAQGSLGPDPFRRIMRDPRFAGIPKILETPKGEDLVANDRRMLRRLRGYSRR
jgi:deoxyribonuclease-4